MMCVVSVLNVLLFVWIRLLMFYNLILLMRLFLTVVVLMRIMFILNIWYWKLLICLKWLVTIMLEILLRRLLLNVFVYRLVFLLFRTVITRMVRVFAGVCMRITRRFV